MNQRGDCTLLGILILLAMISLLTLTSLSLAKSFKRLKQRTNLFLCLKEFKGEEKELYFFISKTNWAIKNISKVKFIAGIIPGLQFGSMKAEAIRKMLQRSQDLRSFSFLKNMLKLKKQGCPINLGIRQSPFEFTVTGLKRNLEGSVILRKDQWKYYFYQHPYSLSMDCLSKDFGSLNPRHKCSVRENEATLYFSSF